MGEWKTLTLSEAGVQLLDCVHKTPPAVDSGYPYVAIPQMKNGEIDLCGTRKISLEDFEEWTKKARPQPFDVILSRRCNPGETAFVRPGMDFALGQNLVLLRSKGTYVKPQFLRWLVRSHYWLDQVEKYRNVGAVFDSLRCADVPNFELPIPQLDEQEAIADLLGALDDKIDLNRRMNETLEAMGQAIFKDWFVDFGPTRAKMEGREPYLVPDVWELFPDRLDDEGRPEGWESKKLEDIADQCKRSISPTNEQDKLFEHYSLPAFDKGQEPAADFGTTIKSNKTPVPKGAVLLSKLNPNISRVWIPNDPDRVPQIASTEFLIFIPKAPVGRGALYCLFLCQSFKQMLEAMVTGTSKSHQRISPSALLKSEVFCGDDAAIEAFERLTAPILQRFLTNRGESKTLSQLRDLLLPKLMSGEIRLREAEAQLKEAV